ncbi:hypothetical protein [uncultured Tenacibaculum sp.]|uniref:hypothetical protein n=1 Tax=uncultured Tenacibaculum sp. TaxID=174713 RepID=UPI00262F3A0C|nr:hypothetical protein [uncultured Tenacibaculum sp.]
MHKEIVNKAFEKTKERAEKESGVVLSKTRCSEYLSTILQDEYNIIYGEKSLRDVSNEKSKINQPKVLEALCKFLDYDNYEAYVEKYKKGVLIDEGDDEEDKGSLFSKKKLIIVVSFVVLLISCVSVFSIKKQRWMVWKGDRYEEVSFDTKKYGIGELKLYKEERIKNFEKIEADCNYPFFGPGGKVNVWYYKNSNGELELFSSVGLHPETGKTLRPITNYMIEKYICIK